MRKLPKQSKINRRRFLKASLLATGALATTSIGRARADALSDKTVIVVGAGCAGLGAAQSLRKQGANVIVVEAKPHIGGRVLTDWSMGAPFEVGAGWIHGPHPDNPSKQLCDAVSSEYVVTDDDNAVTFDADGTEWSDEELTEVAEAWYEIIEELDNAVETYDKRDLSSAISDLYDEVLQDPAMRWVFSAYTEFQMGAAMEDLSVAYFDEGDAFPLPDVVVTTGYDKMLKPLTEGLDIRLSTEAKTIRYSDSGVSVETDGDAISGDYVVCSVPIGILKADKIAFDPPLPSDYKENIEAIGFNSVTKLALKFEEPFWDIETQYFGIATEEKGRWNYWLNYRTFSDENIFLGLSVGAYAPVADAMSDEEMIADGLDVLRGVWGADAVGEPVQALTTHWKKDPHTLGAYSYTRPGGRPNQFDDLAEPIMGRLFLCGEHTFFDHRGTTHGAYMTGLRAAEYVIDEAS